MQRAPIVALTSRSARNGDAEALGLVLNEASACECAIVATEHGGIPEAVRHGETGLLAPENDDGAIAEHINTLLDDAGLARRMGTRGREFVCDSFDIRKQTALLEDVYDSALRGG
jgi:glycosyltransferase involved in cell wall biosynthesis